MADTFDPAGRGPSAYAPRRVREAQAGGIEIDDERPAGGAAVAPADSSDAEADWMTGEIPRFIDPLSRLDPPRPADRPEPQPRAAGHGHRDAVALAARILAVAVAAGAVLFAGSHLPDLQQLVASLASAGTGNASAQSGAKARPSAEAVSQVAAAPTPATGGKTDRQAERVEAAFAEAAAVPTGDLTPAAARTDGLASAAAGMGNPPPALRESPAPPAPAAPAAVPQPQLDAATIAALVKHADQLIAEGDIEAARVLLRRAAEARDAGAALALAATYDPVALEKLGVRGTTGDAALAREWYDKAREFGAEAGTSRAREAMQGDDR